MTYHTTKYQLQKDNETLIFDSEKEACEYLGVAVCTVSSCCRRNDLCKGYKVTNLGSTTHNETKTRLFKIWGAMKERCYREKHSHYKNYGGRGIKVCEKWKNDFVEFKEWAINNGYRENLTLDRINVNGNYEPSNCRWATQKEQHNNTRKNHYIQYKGKTYTISQLSELVGRKYTTLKERIKAGWSIEDAVSKPVRQRTKGYRPSARMDGDSDGQT